MYQAAPHFRQDLLIQTDDNTGPIDAFHNGNPTGPACARKDLGKVIPGNVILHLHDLARAIHGRHPRSGKQCSGRQTGTGPILALLSH